MQKDIKPLRGHIKSLKITLFHYVENIFSDKETLNYIEKK